MDEAVALMILKKLLESVGFKVLTATSGHESIETFKANNVDVVVMDLWMTGMNGIAAAKELKKIDPGVRVVFLSPYAEFRAKPSELRIAGSKKARNIPSRSLHGSNPSRRAALPRVFKLHEPRPPFDCVC